TTGDRLRAQHQWHARFARGGFSTMIFPIKEMATPPVKIHWWKNHILALLPKEAHFCLNENN
ncbi:MAG TPA: hypothetical protein VJI98_03625, partial [Candidatus Nanoarchaeia archaeon]|nr:hypothetical protein [Candidatus Nanoarchaeia archaeon]